MSRRFLSIAAIFFLTPVAVSAQELGSSVSTDDICAARPDLCNHRPARNRKPRRAVTTVKKVKPQAAEQKSERKVRKLKDSDEEFMREFFAKEKEENPFDDAIAAEPKAERKPVAVEPATPRRNISFSSYLNANSNHPALSQRYGGRQDAFQDSPRPAVLTAPSSSGVGVSDAPTEEGSGNRSVRENQPPVPSDSASNRNY